MGYYQFFWVFSLLCMSCFELPTHGEGVVQCKETERRALLRFKHDIQYDRCGMLSSWGDSKEHRLDCCQWEGVSCNNHTGQVVELRLGGVRTNNLNARCLVGSVSNSLLELEYLKYLDFSFNDFRQQPIPSFIGSLTNLRHLNLSNANFKQEIPRTLGNLSKLVSLDLNCRPDQLNHPLDRPYVKNLWWLSGLTSLTYIDMSGIDLSRVTGWFEIVNSLPYLTVLKMNECQIPETTFPSSLSYINATTSLKTVSLSCNDFGGSIFKWLFSLRGINTSLVHLDLSYCFIAGEIPTSIADMNSLSYLNLGLNVMGGSIPNSIWNMKNLSFLSLSWNALSGSISLPDTRTISNNKLTHLDLSGNMFQVSTTLLKTLSQLCGLREVGLSSQSLPFEFSAIMQSLSVCSLHTLESLDLSNNLIWGSIPDMISSFSALRELLLYGNKLNQTISRAIGQLSMLEDLDLSSNALSGTFSHHHMLNLSRLHTLSLSGNPRLVVNVSDDWIPRFQLDSLTLGSCNLGPRFPKWLQTQTNFSWLDISDTAIADVVPVSFWSSLPPNLQLLDMSHNSIYGTIPEVFVRFQTLPRINISTNLFTGAIPSFLVNASMLYLDHNLFSDLIPFLCPKSNTSLTYIDLSNNLFSGQLPNCWNFFDQLTTLYLDNNQLSGNLPVSMSALTNLQALHLRNNSLSGTTLTLLEKCTSLVILDLAYNSLSGYITPVIWNSLHNLGVLILRSNNFVGYLPSSLCELSHLQILDLSHNRISGAIPSCIYNLTAMSNATDLLPTIGITGIYRSSDSSRVMWKREEQRFGNSLGLVKAIDLSNNKLLGEIPRGISHLTGLVSLDLSRNNLSGSVPSEFGELRSLELLDLSKNHLTGKIPPTLAELSYLSILDLSNNNLSGKIPPGTQLQLFNGSAYSGNPGLCGDPLPKCPSDVPRSSSLDDTTRGNDNGNDMYPGLYISVVLGFIVGFWGVCGTLVIKASWRHAFFKFFDSMKC
ncbi:unnamed protein product [Amaranthus hypochondriacus]